MGTPPPGRRRVQPHRPTPGHLAVGRSVASAPGNPNWGRKKKHENKQKHGTRRNFGRGVVPFSKFCFWFYVNFFLGGVTSGEYSNEFIQYVDDYKGQVYIQLPAGHPSGNVPSS